MRPDRRQYEWLADATGFRVQTLEKVVRLGEAAGEISRHPYLASRVVLKGGTALNLAEDAPRRLSVDLDFNYVGRRDLEGMLEERPRVLEAVSAIGKGLGYQAATVSDEHAGTSLALRYVNAVSTPDQIKVDVAFTNRVLLGPAREVLLWQPEGIVRPSARLCSPEEVVAGKLRALLDRVAARDVFDTVTVRSQFSSGWPPKRLKRTFVFYASTLPLALTDYRPERLHRLTERDIRESLAPMLAATGELDVATLVADAQSIVTPLLDFDREETEFIRRVSEMGELCPELLFPDDSELVEALRHHPHLLWKCRNVQEKLRGAKVMDKSTDPLDM